MSKTTLRKRIALTATTALFAGMLSVVAVPSASATLHKTAGSTSNTLLNIAANNFTRTNGTTELLVATTSNPGPAAVVGGTAATVSGLTTINTGALSKGLLMKDASSGTAQTATVLASGALSLYAGTATAAGISATGGTFSSAYAGSDKSVFYNSTNTYVGFDKAAPNPQELVVAPGDGYIASGLATLWTAPATAGTYVISLVSGFYNNAGVWTEPTATNGFVPPTLSGRITVTVVAATAGGAYSATYSACETTPNFSAVTAANIDGVDSTASLSNGNSWGIVFKLRDAYNANLDSGNIVATATGGALIQLGSAGTATSTPVAGTASTVVGFRTGELDALVVAQATAGAAITTTVTITYNGTTVCTKTVTIAGKVATLEVSEIQTQDLSTATHTTDIDESFRVTGQLFRVTAKDTAGNRIATDSIGTFSADSAALALASPTVVAASIAVSATSTSSTSPYSYSVGLYTCGAAAGSAKLKMKFTTTATGEAITSPEFTVRCADNPYTYTASWDKASYVQGDIATLTVAFLDSKGNPANNVVSPGASVMVIPMLTAVTATGSATMLPNAAGVKTYTLTVGLATGITAGTYSTIIDFTGLTAVAATKQTPAIKITTGGDTTTNADVLKSIVALIASINKQIQALQKLILKR